MQAIHKKLHTADRKAGPMQLPLRSGSQRWYNQGSHPLPWRESRGALPGEPPGWTAGDPWGLTQTSRHDYDWNRPKSLPWSCRLPHLWWGAVILLASIEPIMHATWSCAYTQTRTRSLWSSTTSETIMVTWSCQLLECLKQLKIRQSAAFQTWPLVDYSSSTASSSWTAL